MEPARGRLGRRRGAALPRALRRRGHAARPAACDRARLHALPSDADAATVHGAALARSARRNPGLLWLPLVDVGRRRAAGADQDAVAITRALIHARMNSRLQHIVFVGSNEFAPTTYRPFVGRIHSDARLFDLAQIGRKQRVRALLVLGTKCRELLGDIVLRPSPCRRRISLIHSSGVRGAASLARCALRRHLGQRCDVGRGAASSLRAAGLAIAVAPDGDGAGLLAAATVDGGGEAASASGGFLDSAGAAGNGSARSLRGFIRSGLAFRLGRPRSQLGRGAIAPAASLRRRSLRGLRIVDGTRRRFRRRRTRRLARAALRAATRAVVDAALPRRPRRRSALLRRRSGGRRVCLLRGGSRRRCCRDALVRLAPAGVICTMPIASTATTAAAASGHERCDAYAPVPRPPRAAPRREAHRRAPRAAPRDSRLATRRRVCRRRHSFASRSYRVGQLAAQLVRWRSASRLLTVSTPAPVSSAISANDNPPSCCSRKASRCTAGSAATASLSRAPSSRFSARRSG